MRAASVLARVAVLGALALWAGCFGGSSERTEGFACGEDICAVGLVCQYGYCRRPCARDSECAFGGACIASLHQEERRSCTVVEPRSCVDDDDCPDGQECRAWLHDHLEEGRCALGSELPCDEAGQCPDAMECTGFPHDGEHRVCTLPRDVGCSAGCPAASGLICSGGAGGVCREGCDVRRPCAEGYECVDSVCVERR